MPILSVFRRDFTEWVDGLFCVSGWQVIDNDDVMLIETRERYTVTVLQFKNKGIRFVKIYLYLYIYTYKYIDIKFSFEFGGIKKSNCNTVTL